MKDAVSVFDYDCVYSYLRDLLQSKTSRRPSFSMRAWAKQLGFRSNTTLSLVLNQKRKVPRRMASRIAMSSNLKPAESLYLEALVSLSTTTSVVEAESLRRRLDDLRIRKPMRTIEVESKKFLSDPLHSILLEMVDWKYFRPDSQWIRAQLLQEHSVENIDLAWNRLVHLRLVKNDGKIWQRTKRGILSNKPDIADLAVQNYHRRIAEWAAHTIDKVEVQNREYSSYSFNLDPKCIPEAKIFIRNFFNEFLQRFEAKPTSAQTSAQISLQFFPVTKLKRDKDENL